MDSGSTPGEKSWCRIITDGEAEREIREYLGAMKKSGKNRVELLEMVYDLNIPPVQIQKVMGGLCAEGVKDEPGCELYRG